MVGRKTKHIGKQECASFCHLQEGRTGMSAVSIILALFLPESFSQQPYNIGLQTKA
jgi:hypothetical protein